MSGMNVYATNVQPHCDACGSVGTETPSDEVVVMTTRLREALHVWLVVQAKRAGCTAQQLKDAGYTALELRYGGFGGEEVTNAGYTAIQSERRVHVCGIFGNETLMPEHWHLPGQAVDFCWPQASLRPKPFGQHRSEMRVRLATRKVPGNSFSYEGYECRGPKMS